MHDRRRPVPRVPGAWLIDAAHISLIAVPALFGLDLLLARHMFRSLPNFATLAAVAHESTWGIALLLVSALSIAGWRSHRWWLRCAALFALGTAHWIIALCFIVSGSFSTGTTTYPVLAALAWAFALEARLAR